MFRLQNICVHCSKFQILVVSNFGCCSFLSPLLRLTLVYLPKIFVDIGVTFLTLFISKNLSCRNFFCCTPTSEPFSWVIECVALSALMTFLSSQLCFSLWICCHQLNTEYGCNNMHSFRTFFVFCVAFFLSGNEMGYLNGATIVWLFIPCVRLNFLHFDLTFPFYFNFTLFHNTKNGLH